MGAVDFHAHAFPDNLAERAVSRIASLAGAKPVLDGKVSTLRASMDSARIERSVVLSIATKPGQYDSILAWSKTIASARIVPFLSIHHSEPDAPRKIREAASQGFKGFKFHPYYQDFDLDAEAMLPIYEALEERDLICVSHTGFDYSFPFIRKADPPRILNVLRRFPRLKFVATHLGGWKDWDLVAEILPGWPGAGLWIDTSFSLEFMAAEKARALILAFPGKRILFGSDSPWADQAASLGSFRGLGLDPELERLILQENASRLLGM